MNNILIVSTALTSVLGWKIGEKYFYLEGSFCEPDEHSNWIIPRHKSQESSFLWESPFQDIYCLIFLFAFPQFQSIFNYLNLTCPCLLKQSLHCKPLLKKGFPFRRDIYEMEKYGYLINFYEYVSNGLKRSHKSMWKISL